MLAARCVLALQLHPLQGSLVLPLNWEEAEIPVPAGWRWEHRVLAPGGTGRALVVGSEVGAGQGRARSPVAGGSSFFPRGDCEVRWAGLALHVSPSSFCCYPLVLLPSTPQLGKLISFSNFLLSLG